MTKSNRPELDELTPQQRIAIEEGAGAINKLADYRRRSYDLWAIVARGVALLCTVADRPGTSRKARQNLLKSQGYGSLNAGTVSRLLLMAKHETAVRAWRDTLTENKKESWNGPTSICNRCPAIRKAMGEAAKNRKPRAKTNATHEVERALDRIDDWLEAMDDADMRNAMLERLETLTRKHREQGQPAIVSSSPKKAAKPKRTKTKTIATLPGLAPVVMVID